MKKAYYWYNSFVSDPIRSTVGLSSTRLQPFKHRRVQRKRAAAGVRRRHSGAKKVWRRFIERHFLSIRRLETARAKVSQPVFRLKVWCEETNKTALRQNRVVVVVYEEKNPQ